MVFYINFKSGLKPLSDLLYQIFTFLQVLSVLVCCVRLSDLLITAFYFYISISVGVSGNAITILKGVKQVDIPSGSGFIGKSGLIYFQILYIFAFIITWQIYKSYFVGLLSIIFDEKTIEVVSIIYLSIIIVRFIF